MATEAPTGVGPTGIGPMGIGPTGVGIIGCGVIAEKYASSFREYPEIQLVGVTDLDRDAAARLATEHGARQYGDLAEMLADDAVDIAVNLTPNDVHAPITRAALRAGKHVYSEKPLALTVAEAESLRELARERGCRLACSPFTYLGEAQQTAWRAVAAGELGRIRLVFAEVNHGRIESWHPAPQSFYEVGVLFDVGIYPLALLTAIFGPARRVSAWGHTLMPERRTRAGEAFSLAKPEAYFALIELEDGPLLRLTVNYYAHGSRQTGVEFHGDKGRLHLGDWQMPDCALAHAPYGQPYRPLPPLRPSVGMRWGRGARELAQAIREGRPHRASAEQAIHLIETLTALETAAETGRPVAVRSHFPPPERLPLAP